MNDTELTEGEVEMIQALARRLSPRRQRKAQAVRRTLVYIIKCGIIFCIMLIAVLELCEWLA